MQTAPDRRLGHATGTKSYGVAAASVLGIEPEPVELLDRLCGG